MLYASWPLDEAALQKFSRRVRRPIRHQLRNDGPAQCFKRQMIAEEPGLVVHHGIENLAMKIAERSLPDLRQQLLHRIHAFPIGQRRQPRFGQIPLAFIQDDGGVMRQKLPQIFELPRFKTHTHRLVRVALPAPTHSQPGWLATSRGGRAEPCVQSHPRSPSTAERCRQARP